MNWSQLVLEINLIINFTFEIETSKIISFIFNNRTNVLVHFYLNISIELGTFSYHLTKEERKYINIDENG